jgi:trigger factor
MSVTIEQVAPCRKKLCIEVDANRVAGVRAEILEEFRKHASIPGFRPGKAPEPMVEKRFAAEIDDELRKRLVPDSYREAVTEHKIHAIGYPQIESVHYEPGKPLAYIATVDTAPEFKLPDYKGIAVKKKTVTVKDTDVTGMIDTLRDQQADFATVEGRALQNGDFAILNYSGVCDGKPISELAGDAKTLGENKDFWMLIGPDSFLPGFCDQLVGAQAGEKRQVLLDFPADFPQKALAGKKATYFVDVTGIREKKLPELNDEFAKKIGMDNVEKLNEEVRKSLEGQREHEATSELRNQLVEHLLKAVEFELPETLVQQETRSVVYDVVRENTMRGMSKEQLERQKDQIYAFAAEQAKLRLRSSFILDAIAEAEKIDVEDNEVNTRIAELAQRYRTTPERFRAQLEERDGLGEITDQIRIGKTIDFLLANAKVETVTEA